MIKSVRQTASATTKGVNITFHNQLSGGNRITGVLVTSIDGHSQTSSNWESGSTVYRNLNYGTSGKRVQIIAKIRWKQFGFVDMYRDVVKTVWVDKNTSNIWIANTD